MYQIISNTVRDVIALIRQNEIKNPYRLTYVWGKYANAKKINDIMNGIATLSPSIE